MRPIKLIMQAFGPYKNKEVIDFTRLGNRNLFLITGNTGAGKTSIFDAIAYALYGEASGGDRDFKSLISDFADDETITRVIYDFSLNGKHYRIDRIPTQEKKKQRGEGYTNQTASAELYLISPSDEKQLISSRRVTEVNDKIMELIGLDANQFKQIMMLPQNAFRELLTSKSDERQMILQKLFMTKKYQQFETRLKERTKELKTDLESTEKDLTHELAEILITEEEKERYEIKQDLSDITGSIDSLAGLINDQLKGKETLDKEIEEVEKNVSTLADKLSSEKLLLDTFNKRDMVKKEVEALKEKKEQMTLLEESLKRAEKALFVEKEETLLKNLQDEKNTLDDQIKKQLKEKEQANRELDEATKQLELSKTVEKEELEELKINKQKILSYKEAVEKLNEAEKEKGQQHGLLLTLQQKKEEALQTQKETKEKINELKIKISRFDAIYEKKDAYNEKLSQVKDRLHKLETLVEWLDRYKDEQSKYQTLHDEYIEKNQLLKAKEKTSLEIKQRLEQLKQQDAQNAAYKIAATLKENEPCPVCGSVHHPFPSKPAHEIKAGELEKAESEYQDSVNDVNTLKGRLEIIKKNGLISKDEKEKLWQKIVEHPANDFQETVDASQFSQIQDHFKQSLQDYQKLGREISNELKSLIEEEKKLQKYKKALEKGESELDSHTKKAEQLEKQFNESNIAYTLAMSNVERLKKDIPSQYLMKGVLEEEIQATDKKIQTLEKRMEKAQQSFDQKKLQLNTLHTQIQSSQKNIEQLALKVEKQREIFKQELSKYDFETVEAYQKARLDEETISEQRKALETFNTLYTEKTSRLSSLNEELKGKTKPDVELLEKQLTTLNTALDQLKEKRVMLQNRLSENTKRLDKIKTLYEKKQTLENQYGVHGYLWDLTKGANAYRINFERFVQTSFLDDILFAANQKLEGMTDGRYQLNRITETDNKKSTSGLDIEVFDQYTGEARHVKTLSGGEGFKASLAMALGLSEVVQSHSGGVSLETLFIDEGFGSLDSESLDNAIKTLMELQSGGRLVGIISHVAELKERIDTYLEVTSTKDGSYTQFFVP